MYDPMDQRPRRIERAVFETDRLVVVGDVTLPPEGYQSRFSDSLNRPGVEFLALTNCEVTTRSDGRTHHEAFLMLSRSQVQVAYPLQREEPREAPPTPDPPPIT